MRGFFAIRDDQRPFDCAIPLFDRMTPPFRRGYRRLGQRFGPFEPDSSRRLLNRGAETVFLPNQTLDVLLLLVSRAGQA